MKIVPQLLVMSLATTLLVSCGKKSKNKNHTSPKVFTTTFIQGDPETVLAGSTILDKESELTSEFIDNQEFYISSFAQFVEKEVLVKVESSEPTKAEDGNEATEQDLTKVNPDFIFKMKNSVFSNTPQKGKSLNIKFEKNHYGNYELVGIQEGNALLQLEPLHYSVKDDGSAFSILARTSYESNGKALVAISFVKKTPRTFLEKVSEYYKYMLGAGVIMRWNPKKDLTINVCGNPSDMANENYNSAFGEWKAVLHNRLALKTNILEEYPPFSDLNNHCIYVVDNYKTEHREEYLNPATTYMNSNIFKREFVDSDVFIWVKENEKNYKNWESRTSFYRTLAHELGHVLGLDHKFDKNVSSIMSYNPEHLEIDDYDIEAINHLYPLKKIEIAAE